MEYTITEFVDVLREYIYGFFPYESDEKTISKHPNRPLHIRDIAFMWLPTSSSDSGDTITFDIGSDYAEENYPYYHILQDAPVIRKRGRGTTKTKGSQAKVEKLSSRDYGRIRFNGKTYSKEYTKNIRGERNSIVNKATRYQFKNGSYVKINTESNAYKNVHYHYIDKILDYVVPFIANYFDMKLGRKIDTGLEEEYNDQLKQDSVNINVGNWNLDILDIMNSFNE